MIVFTLKVEVNKNGESQAPSIRSMVTLDAGNRSFVEKNECIESTFPDGSWNYTLYTHAKTIAEAAANARKLLLDLHQLSGYPILAKLASAMRSVDASWMHVHGYGSPKKYTWGSYQRECLFEVFRTTATQGRSLCGTRGRWLHMANDLDMTKSIWNAFKAFSYINGEVCASSFKTRSAFSPRSIKIGFLMDGPCEAYFAGDVWSVKRSDGRRRATRPPSHVDSMHDEAWVIPSSCKIHLVIMRHVAGVEMFELYNEEEVYDLHLEYGIEIWKHLDGIRSSFGKAPRVI